ncbi:MAG: hypothetical protein DRI90_11140 [Deltaproteobacteria bacterium]|nr:MAG: hypothetical protein DRI90_11140 [Deltaproteobacteria bacterium]
MHSASTAISILSLGFTVTLTACPRGGCPWTEAGAVSSDPATTCLELAIDDQEDASGGCVNPVIIGTNHCTEALTFAAAIADDGQLRTFDPGAAVEIEVDLENDAVRTEGEDDYAWDVPAQLGDATIHIRFETWLD